MGEISTPNNSRRRRGASTLCHQFPPGSRIEVETKEEDLYGVFFSATVVAPPFSFRKSGSKNSRRLYVEYDNLLESEDKPDLLREYVDISAVRPEPPLQVVAARGFVEKDAVDAFHRDGWWTGVVIRVLERGEKFVVEFEKPPEVHEFGLSELRAHWDWVDGVWARPHKPSEAVFEVGMKVEVSLSDFVGAWFPATISQHLANGLFLVEFYDKEGFLVRSKVKYSHVRPSPPIMKVAKFGESEKVEAFFSFGWRSGVIKKELAKNRYIVLFEETNVENVFDRGELRPLMDWKDGRWFIVSAPVDAVDLTPSSSTIKSKSTTKRSGSRRADSEGAMKKKKKKKKHSGEVEDADPAIVKMLEEENVVGQVGRVEEMGAMKKKKNNNNNKNNKKKKKQHSGGIEDADQENEVTMEVENAVGEVGAMKKEHTGEIEDADQENEISAIVKMLKVENVVGKVGRNRIEETTHILPSIDEPETMETAGAMLDSITPNKLPLPDATDKSPLSSILNLVKSSTKRKKLRRADFECAMTKHNGVTEDANQENEVATIEKMLDQENELVGIELTNLPFVKGNAVWKAFESMEIFQKLPQKPHFKPLEQVKESLREGLAINCMVNFTNVVDRSYSLKIDNPKCEFDDINEILLELKGHGFDVAVVQRHVTSMLAMKEKEEKLVQEVNEFNTHISEHGEKRNRIKIEMGEINEHLRKLSEKLLVAKTEEAEENDEIARLEAGLKEVEEQIKGVRYEFDDEIARLQTSAIASYVMFME